MAALPLLTLLSASLIAASDEDADKEAASAPHVRGLQADANRLLESGRLRSQTVRRLLNELEHSDVVVYLDYRPFAETPTARTVFLRASGRVRYLLVTINPRNIEQRRIELLGHELEHAVEIAHAGWVIDQASFARLYTATGRGNPERRSFETRAAQRAEAGVRHDIQ